MSIYVMTLGELAKKRGEPVGEFVKKVRGLGFDAGSHAKKLTQGDLDVLIGLLEGSSATEIPEVKQKEIRRLVNPNVLLINVDDRKRLVAVVETTLNDDGAVKVEIVSSSVEDSLGESLLEFRKQLGTNLGVN